MRKRTVGLLFLGALLVIGSSVANAQIDMKVTLPFAFQAAETNFPAGSYPIDPSNPKCATLPA